MEIFCHEVFAKHAKHAKQNKKRKVRCYILLSLSRSLSLALSLSLSLSRSLSLSLSLALSLALSLSHTHAQTHTHALTLSLTHTYPLSHTYRLLEGEGHAAGDQRGHDHAVAIPVGPPKRRVHTGAPPHLCVCVCVCVCMRARARARAGVCLSLPNVTLPHLFPLVRRQCLPHVPSTNSFSFFPALNRTSPPLHDRIWVLSGCRGGDHPNPCADAQTARNNDAALWSMTAR